jgi:hypothetical protein
MPQWPALVMPTWPSFMLLSQAFMAARPTDPDWSVFPIHSAFDYVRVYQWA